LKNHKTSKEETKKRKNHRNLRTKISGVYSLNRGRGIKNTSIVVTYEIRVFFEGAKKEVFSSIFLKKL
jgi:hypothetical protein